MLFKLLRSFFDGSREEKAQITKITAAAALMAKYDKMAVDPELSDSERAKYAALASAAATEFLDLHYPYGDNPFKEHRVATALGTVAAADKLTKDNLNKRKQQIDKLFEQTCDRLKRVPVLTTKRIRSTEAEFAFHLSPANNRNRYLDEALTNLLKYMEDDDIAYIDSHRIKCTVMNEIVIMIYSNRRYDNVTDANDINDIEIVIEKQNSKSLCESKQYYRVKSDTSRRIVDAMYKGLNKVSKL